MLRQVMLMKLRLLIENQELTRFSLAAYAHSLPSSSSSKAFLRKLQFWMVTRMYSYWLNTKSVTINSVSSFVRIRRVTGPVYTSLAGA